MSLLGIIRDPLSPPAFERAGLLVLRAGLGLGLLLTVFFAWSSLTMTILLPAALLAGVGGWILFHHPLLNLCTLLCGFVLIAGFEDGTQITEVLYGLYYVAFLAHWYGTRLFLYRERLFERREARVLALFLVLMTLSGALTILFGGSLRFLLGEWLSLSFLSLYFPVREAVSRHRYGVHAIVGVIGVIGLFVLIRNVLNYREIIVSATYAWQVTKGRAVTNESLMMIPSFFALVALLHVNRWRDALLTGLPFGIFFGGLILTQSRGYWVAFAAASVVLLILVRPAARWRLIGIGLASVIGLFAIGYAILGEYFILIVSGIVDRILSIGSAATSDISLVNRIRETLVVWDKVLDNPILGYGMGVPFQFYDLTFLPPFTHVTTFLHNGYLALWYKFGIWGLGMVLYVWGASAWLGVRAFRAGHARPLHRLVGLAVAVNLSAFTLSALTSNPFYINDTMFMFGILMGVAAGIWLRIDWEHRGLVAPGRSVS